MTIDEAIQYLYWIKISTTKLNLRASIDFAMDVLRAQRERENPQPLDVEELMKMGGLPVWVVFIDNINVPAQWYIVGSVDWNIMGFNDDIRSDNKQTWLAYKYPPKEVQK